MFPFTQKHASQKTRNLTAKRSTPWWRKRRSYLPSLELLEDRWVPATLTWNAAADGAVWSLASSWTLTSGTSATGVPGVNDIALFNGTSTHTSVMDANFSITQLQVNAAYTGLIGLGANTLSVSGGFTDANGGSSNLNAGTSTVKLSGTETISSAAALSNVEILGGGTITLPADLAVTNNLLVTSVNAINTSGAPSHKLTVGGSVTANSGVAGNAAISLVGSTDQSLSGTGFLTNLDVSKTGGNVVLPGNFIVSDGSLTGGGLFKNTGGKLVFGRGASFFTSNFSGSIDDLIVNMGTGTLTDAQTLTVNNSLTVTSASNFNTSKVNVTGNVTTNFAVAGNATVSLVGSTDQTLSGTGYLTNLDVSKTGGNVVLPGNFIVSDGSLTGSGRFKNAGGCLVFGRGASFFTSNFAGSIDDLVVNMGSGTVTDAQPLTVNGSLTVTTPSNFNTGKVNVTGNVTANVAVAGNAVISLVGSTDQTLSGTGYLTNLDVSKTGGNVVLPGNFIVSDGALTGSGLFKNSGGKLVFGRGASFFTANFGGTIDDLVVNMGSGTVTDTQALNINNSLTVTTASNFNTSKVNIAGNVTTNVAVAGNAVISLVGSTDQTLSGTGYLTNLDVSKTGGNVVLPGNFIVSDGSLTGSGRFKNAGGCLVFGRGSSFFTSNFAGSIDDLVVNMGSGTVTDAQPLTVNGSLTVTTPSNFNTGKVNVTGNVTANVAVAGNAVISLVGSTDQTLSGTGYLTNLDVSKTGGNVVLPGNFIVSDGALTGSGLFKNSGGKLVFGRGSSFFTSNFAGSIDDLVVNMGTGTVTDTQALNINNSLTVTSASNFNTSKVNVAGNLTTNVAVAGNAVISLVGSGDQTLSGTGYLTNLDVSKTGGNVVLPGNFIVSDGSLTGSGLFKNAGGKLVFGRGASFFTSNFSGTIDDLVVNMGTGIVTDTQALNINNGLTLSSASSFNTGKVRVSGNVTTNFAVGGNAAVSLVGGTDQALSGTGSLANLDIAKTAGNVVFGSFSKTFSQVSVSAGSWDVLGNNITASTGFTAAGGTIGGSGKLNGPVTVGSGGALGGTLTVAGSVTVNSGGQIGVNGTTDLLTINGALTMNAGSTLAAESGGGSNDQVNATGTITLNTPTLSLTAPGTSVGTQSLVLNNQGLHGITGSFSGLAEGTNFTVGPKKFNITYKGGTGNSVVITTLTSSTSVGVNAPAVAYGANGTVTVTVNSGGGTPTGNVSLTVDGGSPLTQPLSGGSSNFTLTLPPAGNHTLSASYTAQGSFEASTANGTLSVGKKALSYTIGNDTQTYGMAANLAADLPATFGTGVNGETLAVSYGSSGDTSATHAGNYTITGAPADGSGKLSNYDVTLGNGTLTVNPKPFSYTLGNDTQPYGSAANLAADLPGTINTGVNGETLAVAYGSTGDTATAHAGNYALTGTLANGTGQAGDYLVTLNNGTLRVNPYAFSSTVGNDSQTYGSAANLTADLPGAISTGVNGQNLAIAYGSIGDTATAHAGNYTLNGTLADGTGQATDYQVTLTPGTLTVNKKPFSYTLGNDTQTYGAAANLAADLPATVGTGTNSDTLALSYISPGDTTTAHVGTYTISGTPADGSGRASDYNVTLGNGTLTVSQKAFSYTIGNDTQTFGSAANLAADLPGTINTGTNGENLAISYSSPGDTNTATAGNYPITGMLSNGTGQVADYNVTLNNGTLRVITVDVPTDVDSRANSVPEGAANGTPVGITASSTAGATFSLTNDAGGRFTIDATTGVVTVANGTLLNFNNATSHQITAQARLGTATATANFTIAVTQVGPRVPSTLTWAASADGVSWSTPYDWTINGVYSTFAPGPNDTVVFDGTSGHTSVLGTNFSVSQVQINATYTGLVSLGSNTLSVSAGFTEANGGTSNLDAGTSTVQFTGTETVSSAASLNSVAILGGGTITLPADLAVANNLVITSVNALNSNGTPVHKLSVGGNATVNSSVAGNATVSLTGGGDQTLSGTGYLTNLNVSKTGGNVVLPGNFIVSDGALTGSGLFKNAGGKLVFGRGASFFTTNFSGSIDDLVVNMGSGTVTDAQPLTVNNSLTVSSASNFNTGKVNVAGNVTTNVAVAGNAVISLTGSGDQTLSGTGYLTNLDISKTGGNVLLPGNFIVSDGTLTGSGRFKNTGGKLVFGRGASFFTANFGGTIDDLVVNMGTGTVTDTQALNINNSLTVTSASNFNTGRVNVTGNLTTNAAVAGNATVSLVGSTDQTLSGTGCLTNLDVSKIGGNVVLPGNFVVSDGSLTGSGRFKNAGGCLVFGRGASFFTSNFAGSIDDLVVNMGTGTVTDAQALTVNNSLTVTSASNFNTSRVNVSGNVTTNFAVAGNAVISLVGSTDQTLSGTGYLTNLDVSKTGGNVVLPGNFIVSDGSLTGSGRFKNTGGKLVFGRGASFFTANFGGTIDDLVVNMGTGTVTDTQALNINNSLTVTTASNFNTSKVNVAGNLTTNFAVAGNAVISLVGSTDQTLSGTGYLTNLDVSKTGGNVVLPANFIVSDGSLTGSGLFKNAGGKLVFGRGASFFTANFSGTIDDLVVNMGTGTVTDAQALNVNNSLTLSSASSFNTGKVRVSGNVTTNFAVGGNAAVSLVGGTDQALSGTGSLANLDIAKTAGNVVFGSFSKTFSQVSVSAGSWDVLGNNITATSGFTAAGGTIKGTGRLNGPVAINSGGTLGGGLTVAGCLTVNSGGTLGLAGSADQVTVNGNLLMNSGSTLNEDVNGSTPGTQFDQFTVNGTVTLNGPALTGTTGNLPAGPITVLVNDQSDAISGTFAGIPGGGAVTLGGVKYVVRYNGDTGNDVTLAPGLSVAATQSVLTPTAGSTVTNSGTFADSTSGAVVTLTASVGSLSQSGTQSGTWNWSLANVAQSQVVAITATDDHGASSVTYFQVEVNGVIPFLVTGLGDTDSGAGVAGDLRYAVTQADQQAKSLIAFLPGLSGTINLGTALPHLTGNLQLAGPGAGNLTVGRSTAGGTPSFSVFAVDPGQMASISGLTIANGNASYGGGIYNHDGSLTVTGCTFTGDNATTVGGAIYNQVDGSGQTLAFSVQNSTFSLNNAPAGSGIATQVAGANQQITLTLSGNTFVHGVGIDEPLVKKTTTSILHDDEATTVQLAGTGNGTVTVTSTDVTDYATLSVAATSAPDNLGVTGSSITLGGETVNFTGVPSVSLDAGLGADTVTMTGSDAATSFSLDAGSDGGTFIGNIAGTFAGGLFLTGFGTASMQGSGDFIGVMDSDLPIQSVSFAGSMSVGPISAPAINSFTVDGALAGSVQAIVGSSTGSGVIGSFTAGSITADGSITAGSVPSLTVHGDMEGTIYLQHPGTANTLSVGGSIDGSITAFEDKGVSGSGVIGSLQAGAVGVTGTITAGKITSFHVAGDMAGTVTTSGAGVINNLVASSVSGTVTALEDVTADGTLFPGTGNFYSTLINNDPGTVAYDVNSHSLYTINGHSVSKLTLGGTVIWTRSITIAEFDNADPAGDASLSALTLDSAGNLLVCGSYDDDDSTTTAFVARYSPNGDRQVLTRLADEGEDGLNLALGIAVSGNAVLVTGYFSYEAIALGADLVAASDSAVFVGKLNSNLSSFTWVKKVGEAGGATDAASIAADADGNIYATAAITGKTPFNGTTFGNANSLVTELSKLDTNGKLLWTAFLGTPAPTTPATTLAKVIAARHRFGRIIHFPNQVKAQPVQASVDIPGAVTVAADKTVSVVGRFSGTLGGAASLTATHPNDVFKVTFNPANSVKASSDLGALALNGVGTGGLNLVANSNIVGAGATGTGVFSSIQAAAAPGTVAIDPATQVLYAANSNATVTKQSMNGTVLWTKTVNSGFTGATIVLTGLTRDVTGNVLVCGTVQKSGQATTTGFVAKFDPSGAQLGFQMLADANQKGLDAALAITSSPSGDILVAGRFTGAVTWQGKTVTSIGGSDTFVAKLPSALTPVTWLISRGGTGDDQANGIAVAPDSSIYVASTFAAPATFDGAPVGSSGGRVANLAKFDTNGATIWSHGFGSGTSLDVGSGVVVSLDGSPFLLGTFQGSLGFGNGVTLTLGTGHTSDVYRVAFNSDGIAQSGTDLGDAAIAANLNGTLNGAILGTGVAGTGTIASLITKQVPGTVVEGPSNTVYQINSSTTVPTVQKFASDGTVVWQKALLASLTGSLQYMNAVGANRTVSSLTGKGIIVDITGNAYVAGSLQESTKSTRTAFVAKFDASGTAVKFVLLRNFSTTTDTDKGLDDAAAVALTPLGKLLVTGSFTGSTNVGGSTLTSVGGKDVFAFQLANTLTGAFDWLVKLGGTGDDAGNAIASDGAGNAIVAATYAAPATFDGRSQGTAGGTVAGLTKLSTTGAVVWSHALTDTKSKTTALGLFVAVDDFIYLQGTYQGQLTINTTGTPATLLTATKTSDLFRAAFKSDGTYFNANDLGDASIAGNVDGVINGAAIQNARIGGNLDGQIRAAGQGVLGTVEIDGDLNGTVSAQQDDTPGSGAITALIVGGTLNGNITTTSIEQVSVGSVGPAGNLAVSGPVTLVTVPGNAPAGSVHVGSVQAVVFGGVVEANGTVSADNASAADAASLLAPGTPFVLADGTFTATINPTGHMALFMVTSAGSGFDTRKLLLTNQGTGGATVTAAVTMVASGSTSSLTRIDFTGDGGSVNTALPITTAITSSGWLGDLTESATSGLTADVTAASIRGNILVNLGPIASTIKTTGDLGAATINGSGQITGVTILQSGKDFTGQLLVGGNLVSQVTIGGAQTGNMAIQGDLGTIQLDSSGNAVVGGDAAQSLKRFGGLQVGGAYNGNLVVLGDVFADLVFKSAYNGRVAVRGRQEYNLGAGRSGILGNVNINGTAGAASALISAGLIGDDGSGDVGHDTLGTHLSVTGAWNGMLAAEEDINYGVMAGGTKYAKLVAENTGVGAANANTQAIDAIFTDGGKLLSIFDPAQLSLLYADLAHLLVTGGHLGGTTA